MTSRTTRTTNRITRTTLRVVLVVLGGVLVVLEVVLVVLRVVLVVLGVVLRRCSEQMFGTDSVWNNVPGQLSVQGLRNRGRKRGGHQNLTNNTLSILWTSHQNLKNKTSLIPD